MKTFRLTEELLKEGISRNNGFSARQIKVLGENMKRAGWQKRLLRKYVTEKQFKEFVELKNQHLDKANLPIDKNDKSSKSFNVLKDYFKLKNEKQIRRFIVAEVSTGKEMSIVLLLNKLIKQNEFLLKQNEELKNIADNCSCQEDSETSYMDEFLYKTSDI